MMRMYRLYVSYPADIYLSGKHEAYERRLRNVAGKSEDGTGMGMWKGAGRDMDWSFRFEKQALAAMGRLKRFKGVKVQLERDEAEGGDD